MRIEIEYAGYNQRRYSKPWGAVVKFEGSKLVYDFKKGNYLGDDGGGKVYIDCHPGDIVASGQRDYRGNGTTSKLYIVQSDGSLQETDKIGALEHYESQQEKPSPLSGFSDAELISELTKRGYKVEKDS